MKRVISKLSRISGIVLGIALAFLMCVVAITSVITNKDFWLKQNDRYNHQETLNLVSSDDYGNIYHSYIAMFEGKEQKFTVTEKGDPKDFTDTFKNLGSVHPSTQKIRFEKNITLDEKFLETVEQIENFKYSKVDLDDKFYIEFSCPLADNDFSGINVENIKITDGSGKEFILTYKTVSILKDGSVIYGDIVTKENVFFKPQSKSTLLRAYIQGADVKDINVAFDVSSVEGSSGVNLKFSYEDALTNEDVADKIGPEKDIITENETEQLIFWGKTNNLLKIVSGVIVVLAVITVIYTVKKQKRESLYGIGVYTVITSAVVLVVINLLVNLVPPSWGFDLAFDFYENSLSSIIMGENFMKDFAFGTVRFFDFIMLLPLFIGYVFIKISRKKHYDPNEDYLYQ